MSLWIRLLGRRRSSFSRVELVAGILRCGSAYMRSSFNGYSQFSHTRDPKIELLERICDRVCVF